MKAKSENPSNRQGGNESCGGGSPSPMKIIDMKGTVGNEVGGEDATKQNQDKPGKNRRRYLGIVLALVAALMYSMSALIVKILNYEPYNLGVWRFLTVILLSIPFLIDGQFLRKQRNKGQVEESSTPATSVKNEDREGILHQIWPPNETTGCLILQAFLGSNAVLFVFFGVENLDVGDAIVIATSAPVFVTFAAWIYLRERCGVVPVVLALCALVGVGIICKPPMLTGGTPLNQDTIMGVSFSFVSMFLLTISYVIIRSLRKVHHAVVQMTFALWGFLESVILAAILDVLAVPQGALEICLVVGSAVLAFSAQTCITLALKYEQAGVVALVRTMEVPMCYLWQFLLLHSQPDLYSVIGAMITLGCVVVAALRNTVMSLEEESPYRRRFSFLLY